MFADASNIACSAVTIDVVKGETGVVKGLLTSKSRVSKRNTSIARLELVSGQMAANMVRNLHKHLNDGPSFLQSCGWTVWSPCIGPEIRENLGKFSYQTESRRWRKLPGDRDQLEVLSNREEFGRPGKQRSWNSQDGDRWVVYRS